MQKGVNDDSPLFQPVDPHERMSGEIEKGFKGMFRHAKQAQK